jgi:hypothetical protein
MRGTMMAALVTALLVGVAVSGLALAKPADAHMEVPLAPTPDAPADASGEARIMERFTRDGLQATDIEVKVSDLPVQDGYVLEGWLVDMETGYKLSLGGFTTDRHGDGTLHFEQRMVNFSLYDLVVITLEPAHDTDPNPGTPLLVGDAP